MHYHLFGILIVNSYLNMKLANKGDKRTLRDFKKSLIRYSANHIREVFSRQRERKPLPSPQKRNTTFRQTANPHKTAVGSTHLFEKKLKGAANCDIHSVRRAVPLSLLIQHGMLVSRRQCLNKISDWVY